MTAPSPLAARDAKIRDLFLLGNPIDTIVAQGPQRGWGRTDCLRVAAEHGWTLDASGRIPRSERRPHLAATPAASTTPAPTAEVTPALPALWVALTDALDHPLPAIRRRAERLQEQLGQLRDDVAAAAEQQKVLDRLAEVEAEREQLRAQLGRPTGKPGRKPKPIEHGTVGGYRKHRNRGEDPCDDCNRANDEHMAKMRGARS